MILNKSKKLLLFKYNNFICENCHKKFNEKDLEIHRIKPECYGGTYEHRNCKILCKKCHEIFSSSQRIAMNIQSRN